MVIFGGRCKGGPTNDQLGEAYKQLSGATVRFSNDKILKAVYNLSLYQMIYHLVIVLVGDFERSPGPLQEGHKCSSGRFWQALFKFGDRKGGQIECSLCTSHGRHPRCLARIGRPLVAS